MAAMVSNALAGSVTNISWDSQPQYNRFILQFDQPVKYNAVDQLKDRKLFYVDLYGINQIYKRRLLNIDDNNIKYVDAVSYNDQGVLRLVFYVKEAASGFQVNALENPARIVVDTIGPGATQQVPSVSTAGESKTAQTNLSVTPGQNSASTAPSQETQNSFSLPQPPTRPVMAPSGTRKVVVIDPGHGGNASGALSKHMIEGKLVAEKDVTLQFAYHLKRMIDSSPNMVALVTRTEDSSLGLYNRVLFAENEAKADLFISIHCNASDENLNARGMEMYFLNEKGTTDAVIKALEETENKEDGTAPLKGGSLLHSLIKDLERDITRDWQYESNVLCMHLERAMLQHPFYRQNYRKIKSANFAVLKNLSLIHI